MSRKQIKCNISEKIKMEIALRNPLTYSQIK